MSAGIRQDSGSSETIESEFGQLCRLAREEQILQSTLALLEWDQHTKLPEAGVSYRAGQITCLAGEIHRHATAPQRGELLDSLANSELAADRHTDAGCTIGELKRRFDRKTRLSRELVEAIARQSSLGQQAWLESRRNNDFSRFAPHLKEIFRLKREEAEAIGYADQPYDALLDEYEPGALTADVTTVLSELKEELVPLIQSLQQSGRKPETAILRRHFPIDRQRDFATRAATRIGFDFQRGRLDETAHPFCTEIGPDDVRITTRYDEQCFSPAFFGTLHEAGHGIYEQGLRSEQYGLPPGEFCSLGIHESQSRLWENLVGRSTGFWNHCYAEAQQQFDAALSDVSRTEFYKAINHVAPSLIRVEADEATYNLHIIIRFEIEQEIINGDLQADDIRDAWNARYRELLGVVPESDADGVLQDVHWSAGLIGYFPTYALGNLYASQFFEAAENELGNLDTMFSEGEFLPLKDWLKENIHQLGKRYRADELGELVSGSPLSHAPLMRHLQRKLAPIYGL